MAEFPKFTCEANQDLRRVVLTFAGTLTFEDLSGYIDQLENAGVVECDHLVDLNNARLALTTPQIEMLTTRLRRTTGMSKPGFTAILARDDLSFGVARMISALLSPVYTVNVFRGRKEAIDWLGWEKRTPASSVRLPRVREKMG